MDRKVWWAIAHGLNTTELNTTESTASRKGKHKVKVGNYLHTNKISKSAIVRRGEHKCMIL